MPAVTEPMFLAGPAGALYALRLAPVEGDNGVSVLYCPPFGEEQNRSRVSAVRCARRLAAAGCTVLMPDLRGSGDSEGEFAEATWDGWLDDLDVAVAQLLARPGHGRLVLWGLRLGSALALAMQSRLPADAAPAAIVGWHPVAAGKTFLTQFLRLRVASGLMDSADAGETVASLREQLGSGEIVEVGGYALTDALAGALESLNLADTPPQAPMHWFEMVASEERPLTPVTRKLLAGWDSAGAAPVEATPIVGEMFWSTPEIVVPDALIDATVALGAGWAA